MQNIYLISNTHTNWSSMKCIMQYSG